jgi:dipeptidyl aminopeptidase/acylaminoacyl peptidase
VALAYHRLETGRRRPEDTVNRSIRTAAALLLIGSATLHAQQRRPIDWPDLFRPAAVGAADLSPDGTRLLYTLTPGSFPAPTRNQQIHLAATDGSFDRAMTHWPDGAHQAPRWHPSGEFFAFTSTRAGNVRQIFFMRADGGEATQVTRADGGVSAWAWSHDGRWLAYLAGRDDERQIWVVDGRGHGEPRRLGPHATPVTSFQWRRHTDEILFIAPDAFDDADARRRRAGYRARTIQRGIAFPDFLTLHPAHVWSIGVDGAAARRITAGALRVTAIEESPTGTRLALVVAPVDRYADQRANEIHLADPATGGLERLTDNDVSERIIGFSPDGALLAIQAPRRFAGGIDDIFVRPVAGGEWRAVTAGFDNDIADAVWQADGRGFHFVGADGVNTQVFRVDLAGSRVEQLTRHEGVVSLASASTADHAVLEFTDPRTPADYYVARWQDLGRTDRWIRLTRANPWADSIRLARYETVRWRSADGTEVEGILTYPLDYDPARRYPLITDIHGGPAAAYVNMFDPTQGRPQRGYMHLLAARGYAVFRPNYRGSSNYGERFKVEISGDYWTRATEDIHAGIDHLIERGIAHADSLGFMGWSAGGHWSNWMLVTSDRFRAISTGAGVTNWISLYGQTDAQASREFYLGGDRSPGAANKPWDDFDHWWNESPLKYIRNAKTPTLIHFGEADERIPMPQGQELHMALRQLGVPTEFIVYPGEPHGLREPTNQLVKIMSELGWFEKWIRGREHWLDWDEVLGVGRAIEEALGRAPRAVPARPLVGGGR